MKSLLPNFSLKTSCQFLLVFTVLGGSLLIVSPAFAATGINKQINFQGKLVDANGLNVADNTYTVVFSLYSVSSGGVNVWTETDSVTTSAGIFQVSLGANTVFPGAVDFNTDNLYLGIKVGSDAEMTPRVRFTAVPYAFMADKVSGLTFASGKTLTVNNSLTFAGTDGTTFTMPSASGTVVTLDASQILTNKTIGSTGLTFSGATTDIDTAAAEGLTLQGRAASSFNTTSGGLTLQAAGAGTTATIQIGAGGAGSTTPDYLGLDVKSTTGDPAGGFEGAMYYNTFDNKFRCFQNAAWTDCISSGGSSVWSALTAPIANLAMNMYQTVGTSFNTTFTYGNATGATNLFNLTDTASNTGTGYLLNLTTATGSTLMPFHVSASGNEAITVLANGNVGIGTASPATALSVKGETDVSNGGNANVLRLFTGGLYSDLVSNTAISLNWANGQDVYLANNDGFTAGGNVGVGTSVPGAKLDVKSDRGTLPAVNISGQTSSAGLVVDNSGVGDLFTASKSGATKFRIDNSGNIIDTVASTVNLSGAALTVASCTGCGGGINYWNQVNGNGVTNGGVTYLGNLTTDLLIGGTASSSAKFGVLNVNNGTPTASLSAGLAGGAYLSATGTLATTNEQTLTLGSTSTGNINFNGFSSCVLTTDNLGNLVCGGTGGTITVVKSANENRTSNAFLDDSELKFSIGANEKWVFRILVNDNNPSTPKIKYQVTAPTGATCNISSFGGANSSGAIGSNAFNIGCSVSYGPGGTAGVSNFEEITGTVTNGSTPGTVTLQWAQNATTAGTPTTIFAGSSLIATKTGGQGAGSGWADDGTTVRLINSSENVGIGTSSPVANLQVGTQVSTGTPGFIFAAGASSNANGNALFVGNWQSNNLFGFGPGTNVSGDNTVRLGITGSNSTNDWNATQNIRLVLNGALGQSGQAALDVGGATGTAPTASISGKTSFATLVVDNSGSGDLLTASSSGLTRFQMANNGSVLFEGDTISSIGTGAKNTSSGAVTNAIGDEGSLVPNAGFESALSGVGFADGWAVAATNSAIVTRDTTSPAKGLTSAKVSFNGANQSTAIYSTCMPLALQTSLGNFILNFYAKPSIANRVVVRGYIDAYTSKANCESNTTPSISTAFPTSGGLSATSWALTGSGSTAITFTSTTNTWGRVHIFVGCPASCSGTTTVNIDGVRLVESALTGGIDYAEQYPAESGNMPEAGDVVSIVASGSASIVKKADHYMDTSAIGVVSTNPGEVLDDGTLGDAKVPVALAGRIPTKVSTKNGPIYVGDYLTASDIPGVAVKAITAGPVIGQAMAEDTDTDPKNVGSVVIC